MDSKAFRTLSYGLYIIGSAHDGKLNGQVANTVFQISSYPGTIALGINKQNLTNQLIKNSKKFSVAVLAKNTSLSLIGNFGFKSGREADKFTNYSYKLGAGGTPVLLDSTIAYFEAEVADIVEVETHTVFIGRVTEAEVLSSEEPMTYAYYHQLKKGAVPPAQASTPASQPEENTATGQKQENPKMKKYQCSICGYIYDPAVGDPDSGIAPGTAFEDIPADWVCPICGASKDQFETVD